MSEDGTEEETTTAEPVKVKQVAIAAGLVTAALTAAVAFTVAGPLGVGIAAAGVAGTGYAAHRVRHPKAGRPGVLHSWLTRTRRTRTTTTKTGTLTWPFTGNQQKRAVSGHAGRQSSRSRLPSLTSSRARRSQALTGTGAGKRSTPSGRLVGGSATGSRPAKRSISGGFGPGGKPSTPSRSPEKLSSSRVGSLARSKTGTPARRSTPSTASLSRRTGSGGTSGRFSKPLQLTNSRSRHRPTTGTPTRKGLLSLGPKNTRGGGKLARRSFGPGTTPGRSSSKGTSRRIGRPGSGRFNPWLGTRGGRSLGGRSTGSRKTRRAERIGNPLGTRPTTRSGRTGATRKGLSIFRRWSPDHNRDTAPNRTRLKPRPYVRRTNGQLLRTSLRVPKRQRGTFGSRRGWRPYVRPTRTQAARARRTLRLRSAVSLRQAALWIGYAPHRWWDSIWAKVPQAPKPLTHYTEQHKMKTATGPKHKTPNPSPTNPTPSPISNVIPINRKALRNMSGPVDTIVEAFQQLATFHPSSAVEVEQVLIQQQEMFAQIGAAYSHWAEQLTGGMPFEQAVADQVREIGVAASAVGGVAQNAHQTYRTAHAADIARIEQPRPDEGMWDPGANR